MMTTRIWGTAATIALLASTALADTLRIGTWNLTFYDDADTRGPAFKTSIYGTFQGRSFAPDVLLAQEIQGPTAASNFLSLLNTAPGSPGDWAMAPFVDIDTLDNVTYYRTSKLSYLSHVTINPASGPTPEQPRDTVRYDLQVVGTSERLGIYNLHMKAGQTSDDQARRQVEADRIRRNAAGEDTNGAGSGLPGGYHFLLAGDLNMGSANQQAWQSLTSLSYSPLAPGAGRFFDPINATGTWSGSTTNWRIQTNDPRTGLDDRFDVFGLSSSLVDGIGTDYVGLAGQPFSTTTWDDPNHSYTVWGNDGLQGVDGAMTTAGNLMVGDAIAGALFDASPTSGGHLPVFLDIEFSPAAAAPEPASLALLALGLGILAHRCYRLNKFRR